MTEQELFVQSIPAIAELVVWARTVSDTEFEMRKQEALEGVSGHALELAEKLLGIVETYR